MDSDELKEYFKRKVRDGKRFAIRDKMLRQAYEVWLGMFGTLEEVQLYCVLYHREIWIEDGMVKFKEAD